ncbi:MAG: TIGR00282 family metallophosphoesterase [Acholeplasmataceae bacterium]|jgi:metallophosphoesterase (TIGR00282 family)|nr:TIGR00282 family metallophosphoesterase [Acholeplasmataceae bacterium]MDY0338759.1 TIGR00282 family metallophosphoesterase [Acholeplasmataceae bacterium]
MKVLFVGDIYGQVGLDMLKKSLPYLKLNYKPNVIIVNAENASSGRGINQKIYKELMECGVSAITMGNWVWGNRELFDFIDESNVVRPINFRQAPGTGSLVINYNGKKLQIINALGRTFMNANLLCPFVTIEEALDRVKADYSLIDIHAEATSEKVALGHYLDGKATAIVGTHTHIPTADERVLPNGTLYITDVGMTGPLNGVIGVKKHIVLDRFLNGFSTPNEVEVGAVQLNAVFMDFIHKKIERIHMESETV